MKDEVYVFGHQRPDTDSVTSAISLSYLKNNLGINAIPKVLGEINNETKFVLDYFKVKAPSYLDNVKIQIKNVDYYKDYKVNINDSIKDVYDYLKRLNITGAPVVDSNNKIKGVVTSKDILHTLINNTDYIDTTYDNIIKVLNGKELLRNANNVTGKIITSKTNISDKSILITNDLNITLNSNINTLIITVKSLSHEIIKQAYLNKINIIYTDDELLNIYHKLLLSDSIKNVINKDRIIMYNENYDYLKFLKEAKKLGHNNYPIINKHKDCLGLIRITDKININKKKVILVDHNEIVQSVDGLDEAEIIEIVDHHKIGSISTNDPINFRNMSVGSTNTIIYEMYKESHIDIPYEVAGLMISGILSDTLGLTSSTTTKMDEDAVINMSCLMNLDYKKYYEKMLKAGTSIEGLTKLEVLNQDYKSFTLDDSKFGIAQTITLDFDNIMKDMDEYLNLMEQKKESSNLDLLLFVVTDAIKNGSYLLYTKGCEDLLKEAFNIDNIKQGIFLKGITSRKKQVVPKINELIK